MQAKIKVRMKNIVSIWLLVLLFASNFTATAQSSQFLDSITYEEYLAMVKKFHPLTKQADLIITEAEGVRLKARGSFDPKLEADYNRKKFKGIEYYDKLNAAFKIPTWFGIELFGDFEENTGQFLNPENSIPEDGLYSAGVSLPLAKDLLINQRMADLRKSRFFLEQSKAERTLQINNVLYSATQAYLNWVKAKREVEIYEDVVENSSERLSAVIRTVLEGQEAPIDSTEAKINFQTRQLGLEAARLYYAKAKLEASNFLWLNGIPIEFEDAIIPVMPANEVLVESMNLDASIEENLIDHPKLRALDYKIKANKVELNLKKNNLLPEVDLKYNFLSTDYEDLNSFNTNEYKAQLNFRFPIFLRKERGELTVAKAKLQDAQLDRNFEEVVLKNKINNAVIEIESLLNQNLIMDELVINYRTMLNAEERKFFLGESSLFVVNSREQKFIEAQLKQVELSIKQLEATAKLFNVLGRIDGVF